MKKLLLSSRSTGDNFHMRILVSVLGKKGEVGRFLKWSSCSCCFLKTPSAENFQYAKVTYLGKYVLNCIRAIEVLSSCLVPGPGIMRQRSIASWGFPDSSVGKESACIAGDPGSIPGQEDPLKKGKATQPKYSWASLVAQLVKNLPTWGRPGFDPWVGKILWRRERLPTPVFWPGEFHGLYSACGPEELDSTKWLSLSLLCAGCREEVGLWIG